MKIDSSCTSLGHGPNFSSEDIQILTITYLMNYFKYFQHYAKAYRRNERDMRYDSCPIRVLTNS